MSLALRQYIYLVFVEVPLNIQDVLAPVFGYMFRAVWWLFKWSVLAGIVVIVSGACALLFGPMISGVVSLPVWGLVLIVWIAATASAPRT